MSPRRLRLLAGILVIGLAAPAVPAWGQEVGEAERGSDSARSAAEEAYGIASAAAADRDRIEADLFAALERYRLAGEALTTTNRRLERINGSLAFAESSANGVQRALEDQAVEAYMQAAAIGATLLLASEDMTDALLVGAFFESTQADTLAGLDRLLVQRRELSALRAEYAAERSAVAAIRARLDDEAGRLGELYAAADAAVAEAFRRAEEADAAYRASLDALDLARAAAADRRRAEEAATAAGTATSTTAPASTTTTAASATTLAPSTTASAPSTSLAAPTTIPTTTTTTTPAAPRPAIKPAVERWRPQVSAAFPADLVEDALVIMQCESGGDPNAVNPYSGAAGLYQFMPGTWAAASVKAGVGDRSVFDGEANIIAAAWLAGYYRSRGYDPWEPWAPCRVHL
jgi:hypothetical protein